MRLILVCWRTNSFEHCGSRIPFTLHTGLGNLNRVFSLWKRLKCFASTLRRTEKFEMQQSITGNFKFVLEENSGREIAWLSQRYHFRKASFPKCFPSTLKHKTGVSKILRFEERFLKPPYLWRIRVDGRANRWKKSAFLRLSADGASNANNEARKFNIGTL